MYSERILSFNLSMILYRCDVLQALSCPLPCDPLYLYHEHIGYHCRIFYSGSGGAFTKSPSSEPALLEQCGGVGKGPNEDMKHAVVVVVVVVVVVIVAPLCVLIVESKSLPNRQSCLESFMQNV